MSELNDLTADHALHFSESLAGWAWTCDCGSASGSEFPLRRQAEREAERHMADALGLRDSGSSVGPDPEFRLLVRLMELGRRAEVEDVRDQAATHAEVLNLLATLKSRDFVSIEKPLYGDNRLMSAHGISLTFHGQEHVRARLHAATDILEAASPDAAEGARRTSFADIEDTRRGRAEFMSRLYLLAGGSTSNLVDAAALGFELGWQPRLTASVVQYLTGEGLISRPGLGAVSLTHGGVKEVEQLQMRPEERTEHFNPINIITVYGNNSGQIQAGTSSSSQSQVADTSQITQFLDALEASLDRAQEKQAAAAIRASIDLVRESLAADGPDAPLVRRLLPGLRDFAINLAASGTFLGLSEAAAQLPAFG